MVWFYSIAYTSLTDHESARECYRKALELDPTNQSYQNNLEIAEQKLKEAAMQVWSSGTTHFIILLLQFVMINNHMYLVHSQ